MKDKIENVYGIEKCRQNKYLHISFRPRRQHVLDMASVVDGDEEAPGPSEDEPVTLTGQTDGGSIDDGHHLLKMVT